MTTSILRNTKIIPGCKPWLQALRAEIIDRIRKCRIKSLGSSRRARYFYCRSPCNPPTHLWLAITKELAAQSQPWKSVKRRRRCGRKWKCSGAVGSMMEVRAKIPQVWESMMWSSSAQTRAHLTWTWKWFTFSFILAAILIPRALARKEAGICWLCYRIH